MGGGSQPVQQARPATRSPIPGAIASSRQRGQTGVGVGAAAQHEGRPEHQIPTPGPLVGETERVPVAWMEVGDTTIFARDKVRSLSDLEGMKIRVANV